MRDLEKQKAWRRAARKADSVRTAEYQRKYRTLWRYGLTVEEYDAMLSEQDGVCKICQQACLRKPRLSVDHSHATGTVRGLLCHDCNCALGLFKDCAETIMSAALYLQGDNCQMGFKDRIAAYNAQKDTKVNPPEAKTVLETKSAPEVENVKPLPAAVAAAPEPSATSPAVDAASPAPAPASAEKKGRGRPAGSKNSAKPPAAEPTTEATSPAPSGGVDPTTAVRALLALPGTDGRAFAVEPGVLVEALFLRGYGVTRL